jgi:hypothetical protein
MQFNTQFFVAAILSFATYTQACNLNDQRCALRPVSEGGGQVIVSCCPSERIMLYTFDSV